ncbi:MAG: NAD(P)-dependent oxidoreductase [Candidatus Thermoplasmatota archaeon]|jgi:nucleoside-diphosphate-sugar epimerase|nr:NAD(P)-dependent oxidoreductase [Candidatus Thermoplasmatota archaeon]
MKVLVTGGTGFIGSHLVDELLDNNYNVRVLKRRTSKDIFLKGKKVTFSFGDLGNPKSLEKACLGVDIVFHIAAIPRDWGSKKDFYEVNLKGTKNLLDACVKNRIPKFVYMSSAAVYGFPKTNQPITEDYPKKPAAKYGKTKYKAEQLLWKYGLENGIFVSAIRSPLVTGPRDRMIAPFLINALKSGRFFYIGSGEQKISISDARDIAYLLRIIGETRQANAQVYNVKSFDCTPRQIIEKLSEKINTPLPKKYMSYKKAYFIAFFIEGLWTILRRENPLLTKHKVKVLGHNRIINISKAENELGYKPKYDLNTTIDDTVMWYNSMSI